MLGYFFSNSASIFWKALLAGGLTQLMIFRVTAPPEPPDELPLDPQAAAASATSPTRAPAIM